jgi:hypothetical protein
MKQSLLLPLSEETVARAVEPLNWPLSTAKELLEKSF